MWPGSVPIDDPDPNGSFQNIERNDGVYPTPHWERKFVILVDDGDADNPPDREGRVRFR